MKNKAKDLCLLIDNAYVFQATDEELKKFVTLYDHIEKVPAVGCDLEGVHYIVPRTEQNLIFGKRDKTGIFAAKTKSGLLFCLLFFIIAAEIIQQQVCTVFLHLVYF
ncbi:unnamed protein product [Brugia timori]|uniref:DNA topoisomerase n=1 Tax=Brugia timori TaxID=42155 RepID=A0A0R3QIW0_9BILA|nr:unnamed protein product [Brugia timori]